MSDRFLRIKDIAERLGIKPRSVIEYRCKNRLTLTFIKKDGMLGCFESDYRRWMERTDNQKLA